MPFKKDLAKEDLNAYIGTGLEIEGNIVFQGTVKFEGKLKGQLSGDKVIIGDTGIINGEIEAEEIICSGTIDGRVRAKSLHLKKTARFKGEILAERLLVEEGAKIEGQIKVGELQTRPSEAEKVVS